MLARDKFAEVAAKYALSLSRPEDVATLNDQALISAQQHIIALVFALAEDFNIINQFFRAANDELRRRGGDPSFRMRPEAMLQ